MRKTRSRTRKTSVRAEIPVPTCSWKFARTKRSVPRTGSVIFTHYGVANDIKGDRKQQQQCHKESVSVKKTKLESEKRKVGQAELRKRSTISLVIQLLAERQLNRGVVADVFEPERLSPASAEANARIAGFRRLADGRAYPGVGAAIARLPDQRPGHAGLSDKGCTQTQFIEQAKRYLENRYKLFMQTANAEHLRDAHRDGILSILNLWIARVQRSGQWCSERISPRQRGKQTALFQAMQSEVRRKYIRLVYSGVANVQQRRPMSSWRVLLFVQNNRPACGGASEGTGKQTPGVVCPQPPVDCDELERWKRKQAHLLKDVIWEVITVI
ncbi:nuclear pore complex protein nup93 [Culex quinquefasciatus]|uniref:Nuclear pore complex protein nup93 n=1 Tax=Culex quinquefasciatus TaxID=7176 RepID=B0WGF1_CULQU|nr:nuclear pore complex protein nup93 [Culex quinquefasciatus]|eukprot:XP_001847785.1 nuclear pore complex protein nup93 [Culex quinquefasciatus]